MKSVQPALQCRIVRPIFFKSTRTAIVYRGIIHDFIPFLKPEKCHAWFQQINTPAHKSQETAELSYSFFAHHTPAPDLSISDFLCGVHLKIKDAYQVEIKI